MKQQPISLTLTPPQRYALNNALGARISQLRSNLQSGFLSPRGVADHALQLTECEALLSQSSYEEDEVGPTASDLLSYREAYEDATGEPPREW